MVVVVTGSLIVVTVFEEDAMKCPSCQKSMKRTTVEHMTMVGDDAIAVEVRAWDCPSGCHEQLVEGSELERAELEVASRLVSAGRINPATFRFLRTVLGWSGREAARQLGVAHESISRWENGSRELDRLAWLLLASATRDKRDGRHDTELLLKAAREPGPLA